MTTLSNGVPIDCFSWRHYSCGDHVMNQGEDDQHEQGGIGEDVETACTYCGRAQGGPAEEQLENTYGYPFWPPTEG